MGSLSLRPAVHGCGEIGLAWTKTPASPWRSSLSCCCKQIVCSLRDKGRPRRPLGKGRVMTIEAIQAVQALKRNSKHTHHKVDEVYNTTLSRLLKADLLATLAELQRQNEFDIALKVFDLVRKELWYKPDLYLYAEMILMVGRNKLIDKAELLFSQLKEDGLEPDTRVCTELLCAYTRADMIGKAMEIYEMMKKESGSKPNELTFTILISSLERAQERDLVNFVKRDAIEYVNDPAKFLESFTNKQLTH